MRRYAMLMTVCVLALMANAQTVKVKVATPGSLGQLLAGKGLVEKLVVSGNLNAADLSVLRSLPSLKELDLSKVKNRQLGDSLCCGMVCLEKAVLPKKLYRLGRSAFEGCVRLKHLSIPYHLEAIPDQMLKDCASMDRLYAHNSKIELIGKGAFMNSGLRMISMPPLLQTIDNMAFANCQRLETVHLPKWVLNIHSMAFANCQQLRTIEVSTETPPICAPDAFVGLDRCTLYVKHPESYRDREPWNKIDLSYEHYNGEELKTVRR